MLKHICAIIKLIPIMNFKEPLRIHNETTRKYNRRDSI